MLIFYADKLSYGDRTNLRVFNFAILLKSLKFDARKIYMFYSRQWANTSQVRSQGQIYPALLELITELTMIINYVKPRQNATGSFKVTTIFYPKNLVSVTCQQNLVSATSTVTPTPTN